MARRGKGIGFHVEGMKEIDKALKGLELKDAKQVARRALTRAAKPVVEEARDLAPIGMDRDSGEHLYETIQLSRGTRSDRKRASNRPGDYHMFITATAPHAVLQEFGTEHHSAQPFLRPAWDARKVKVLGTIKSTLWEEIQRRVRLNAKKAARDAAKGR